MTALELKKKMKEQKEVLMGLFCFEMDPGLIEAAAARKMIDFVIIELEHTPYFANDVVPMIMACEVNGIVPIVRVPEPPAAKPLIQKVLDQGAKGIAIPMVRSGKEMRDIIAATRFQPEGTRGAAPGSRGTGKFSYYTMKAADWAAKVKQIHEEQIVIALPLETLDGLNNLEDIISTPGLDLCSLSIIDVGHALGRIGDMDHPDVRAAQGKLIDLSKKYNMPLYQVPAKPEHFKYWYDRGVRVFIPVDTTIFEYGFLEFAKGWRDRK